MTTVPTVTTMLTDAVGKRCERRRAPRFPCALGTPRHVIVRVPTGQADQKISSRVRNISATGLSMVVDRPLEAQGVLDIELRRPSRFWHGEIPIRVVYTLPHPGGEYIIGAAFARTLTPDELTGLLGA